MNNKDKQDLNILIGELKGFRQEAINRFDKGDKKFDRVFKTLSDHSTRITVVEKRQKETRSGFLGAIVNILKHI